jgi:hypothetical protein
MVQVPREPYRIQGCGAIIAPQRRAPPGILDAQIVRQNCSPSSRATAKDYAYGKRLTLESPYKAFPNSSSHLQQSNSAQAARPRTSEPRERNVPQTAPQGPVGFTGTGGIQNLP